MPKAERIWELDMLRGAALIGMIGIHLIYDLVDLFGVLPWRLPQWYLLFKNNYGALFLLISGVSVTLGSRCVRRGLTVFCAGFLCTAVTFGMYLAGMADAGIIIYFGVLQCLGCCMLLWPLFRKLPDWLLVCLGIGMAAAGLWLRLLRPEVPWLLIPFGFAPGWFASSDYFPLLPNLGYFLLGAVLGRRVYAAKKSLFPDYRYSRPPVGILCAMGRHSLLIYLLHQPLLAAAVLLLTNVF